MCSSELRRHASATWFKKQYGEVHIYNGRTKELVAVLVPFALHQRYVDLLVSINKKLDNALEKTNV